MESKNITLKDFHYDWDLDAFLYMNDTTEEKGLDIIHHPFVKVFFFSFYTAIFVLGLVGNGLVCFIIIKNKSMQTVTNLFITNLALADLLLCLLAVPITPLYTLIWQEWIFGEILCILIPYAQGVSVYLSTLTLSSIAVDRFIVIMFPFKRRINGTCAVIIIACIWAFAVVAIFPYAVILEYGKIGESYHCYEVWPSSLMEEVFNRSTTTFQYILPFIIISICYVTICIKLAGRETTITTLISRRDGWKNHQRKKRTIRMLIAIVVIFGVCWFPINLLFLVTDLFPESKLVLEYYQVSFFLSHTMAMSSCCYNPLLYIWMNKKFRSEFKKVTLCSSRPQSETSRVTSSPKTSSESDSSEPEVLHMNTLHALNQNHVSYISIDANII